MTINNKKLFIYATVLFLLTAGCSGVSKSYPERTMYMFDIPIDPVKYNTASDATVVFRRFHVSPSNEGKQFIYRTTDIEYESDFYNQFFRPPGAILTEETSEWVAHSGLFKEVLSPVSQIIPIYSVEGVVNELYGDYRNPSNPKAVMELQFFLFDFNIDLDDETDLLIGKTYSKEKGISSRSPQALMDGWNDLLGEILQEFLDDINQVLNQKQ